MITAWNTGRKYSQHGQRIAATLIDAGIVFVDLDRGIDGFHALDRMTWEPDSTHALMLRAMEAYDCGDYDSAWEYPDAIRDCKHKAANQS